MDGAEFARAVEVALKQRGISKGEFYDAVGVSATAMYGWKRGAEPKKETVRATEQFLGVSFSDVSKNETTEMDPDLAELLEFIRNRPDLAVLLRSANDVPPSSVYSLVSQLELEKERNAQ